MTVIDTVRTETISANIQGENAGQIAVGNYNLQIGSVHGGRVNVILPGRGPRLQPRKPPVFLRPRPVRGMLDREAEVNAANAGLQEAVPLEFYAQSGMGKTTLLRHLAHHAPDSSFPDGVLYLSARRQPLADILQSLVDAFYISDDRLKFTDAQLRHALQSRRALILLDDVDLAADEMTEMLDVASGCTFVFASPQRQLWGEGRTVALRGLPLKDSLKLMERELGRRLKPEERPAAAALCEALKGHPLHILQVTASAREDGLSLAEMAAHLPAVPSSETVTGQVLASLSASERQVLAALAAVDGAPLSVEHLNAMTELPDAAPILESLLQRGLIQAHSPRYSLTGSLNQVLARVWDLTPWADRALSHFTAWAERQRPTPDRLLEVADAILQTLKWAAGAGRWLEVLRLGRAVEGDLALSGRWGAWAEVLRIAYQAAQGLGDRAAEAWALHQLGTRALCLEDTLIARSSLIQALRLREAMGDQAGAALTRHNLNILLGSPPPPQSPTQSSPPAAPVAGGSFFVDTIIAFFTVLAIVLSGLVFWQYWPYRTPAIVALAPTPTHTAAATPSTILSPTASPTVTAPATETFTPTSMPTATQEPTHTPTSTPTFTPSPSPTLTPSPTFTLSPSPTLTPSPTPTFIPSPSPTLTRIPTDTPQPEPVIKFWADRYEIRSGECTTTHWDADYVQEVYYQGQGVVGHGERWECPGQTAAYTLTVVRHDGNQEIHTVTVKVIAVTVPPSPPDLVVTALQATGGPSMISDRIELPIRVVVKNQGDTPADTFKVSMEYNGPNGTFVIPFTAKGQSSIWYPSTSAPLGPGIEAFFEGVVTFRLDLAGEAVSLRAIADSCSGDEFMPSYCRVEESNESNNGSNWIKAALPTPTPTPTPTPRIVL